MANELYDFIDKMGKLSEDRKQIVYEMGAKRYWSILEHREFPLLYQIAKPVNQMICSSGAAERIWSIDRFIHSRLRNRLSNEKVEKLVFLCLILCMIVDERDKNEYILEEGATLSGSDHE